MCLKRTFRQRFNIDGTLNRNRKIKRCIVKSKDNMQYFIIKEKQYSLAFNYY